MTKVHMVWRTIEIMKIMNAREWLSFDIPTHNNPHGCIVLIWRPSPTTGPMLILDGYANLAESDTVYTHNLMCKGSMDYKVPTAATKL